MTMKLRLPALILGLAPLLCMGGVNPRNGNFFITYEDIAPTPAGVHALEIRRTYNSKSARQGWLGYGWSTLFETYLVVLPDGSGLVRENGGGADTFYRNPDLNAVRRGARRLAQDAVTPGKRGTADENTLYGQLLGDEDLRAVTVERLALRYAIPAGQALAGYRCSNASLRATGTDYRRTGCEGETDVFDLQGQLLRRVFDDGYELELVRAQGKVTQVRDNRGHFLQLGWGDNGRLDRVLSSGGKQARYRQDPEGNLAESEDARGNVYRYRYDGRHNLSRIEYADTSYMEIEYVSPDSAMARRVQDRNGAFNEYDYSTDPQDPRRYSTRVSTVTTSGERSSRNFDFQDAGSAAGALYAASLTTESNSRRTRLDSQGRPVERLSPDGRLTRIVYDDHCNKPARVTTTEYGETDFTYGKNCRLTRLVTRDGWDIRLAYDSRENIAQIWSGQVGKASPKLLRLSYDDRGQPVIIRLEGVGTIHVTWEASGEIRDTVSPQGPKMALAVTQVFQELLSRVKRAQAFARD